MNVTIIKYKDVSRLCEMNEEEYVGKFEILSLRY